MVPAHAAQPTRPGKRPAAARLQSPHPGCQARARRTSPLPKISRPATALLIAVPPGVLFSFALGAGSRAGQPTSPRAPGGDSISSPAPDPTEPGAGGGGPASRTPRRTLTKCSERRCLASTARVSRRRCRGHRADPRSSFRPREDGEPGKFTPQSAASQLFAPNRRLSTRAFPISASLPSGRQGCRPDRARIRSTARGPAFSPSAAAPARSRPRARPSPRASPPRP